MQSYLSIGSNLGNRQAHLDDAVRLINTCVGHVIRRSDTYVSPAWGYYSDNEYFNICILIETTLEPLELLKKTQKIEKDMGRTHKTVNGQYHDRIIDIDILTYDNQTITLPELTIPHPLMKERDFVMIPLRQIMHE